MSQHIIPRTDQLDDWFMINHTHIGSEDNDPPLSPTEQKIQTLALQTIDQSLATTNPFRNPTIVIEITDPDIESLLPDSKLTKKPHSKNKPQEDTNIDCRYLEEKIASCCLWFWSSCDKKKVPRD
jgi:hypothetical protein